jgi:phosphatidyl-myo-inositol dimannoside synthase
LVVLDPAVPVGIVGRWLACPYAVVVHGAEVTVPGRLPVSRDVLGQVLRGAELVISAGGYPAAEAEHAARRALPTVIIPPGVDARLYSPPASADARRAIRARLGFGDDAFVVAGLSRLVPRKGFDTLIEAVAIVAARRPEIVLAISGSGRDRSRLERLAARLGAPVRFLGRISDDDKVALLGAADLFAMLCRNRWGGLEQEGFGIVFVEAAACGTSQLAGLSGGAAEAVVDGVTGVVVAHPQDPHAVAAALATLADDPATRLAMGTAARRRAVEVFDYDHLAARLWAALEPVASRAAGSRQ